MLDPARRLVCPLRDMSGCLLLLEGAVAGGQAGRKIPEVTLDRKRLVGLAILS